jgi:hypothetical protein
MKSWHKLRTKYHAVSYGRISGRFQTLCGIDLGTNNPGFDLIYPRIADRCKKCQKLPSDLIEKDVKRSIFALQNDEGYYFYMFHDLSDGEQTVDFSKNVAHADFFDSKESANEECKDLNENGHGPLGVVEFKLERK